MLALLVSACNSHTERPTNGSNLILNGQQIYVENCAACHQVDGSGYSTLYPRLANNPIVTLDDPEPIIVIVTYGEGSMNGYRDTLNEEEIAAVLSYIRNAWGNKAYPVSPRQIQ